MIKIKQGECYICKKFRAVDEDWMCGACAAEAFVKGNKDAGATVPLDRLVSTEYIVQVSAGGEWLHSNSHATLKGARDEKARMNKISAHPRRIIKKTWAIVEC